MKIKPTSLLILLALVSFNGNAENKQSHSTSCGAMALSQLIIGYVSGRNVSEQEVINLIRILSGNEDEYSIGELESAAKKLGLKTMIKTASVEELQALNRPVVLLINLNSGFSHFVVFKGVRPKEMNGTVYYYDPATGDNVRMPYEELIENSINEEHPLFNILAVEGAERRKDSPLALSENESERNSTHHTQEQANALTMANLSNKSQLIVNYGFTATLGNNKNDNLNLNIRTKNYNHVFAARYGLDDNGEIGGSIQYSDNTQVVSINSYKEKFNDSNRQYSAYIAKGFKLDDLGRTNLNFILNGSYAENSDLFGVGLTVIGSKNTEFAQFSLGGSVSRQFTYNKSTRSLLPEYLSYSGFVGVFKPLTERLSGSMQFEVSQGENENKNRIGTFGRYYSASTSLSYALTREIQIAPSFAYNFGATDTFSFGMNIAYVGGW